MQNEKRLSVIGTGKIAQAYAELWIKAGYSVVFGSRNTNKTLSGFENTPIVSIEEALQANNIVLLAIPHESVEELIKPFEAQLENKIIMDATNPFAISPDMRIYSPLPDKKTEGEYMAELFPKSIIIRAFNHIMDELIVNRGTTQKGLWAMAVAGDHPEAKELVFELVADAGFTPVNAGSLSESAILDPGGILFPNMFLKGDMEYLIKTGRE